MNLLVRGCLPAMVCAAALASAPGVVAQAPSPQRPEQLAVNATVDQLRAACDRRDGVACDELGRRYMGVDGVARNDALAFEAFTRACNYNNAMGCARLGYYYELGRGTTVDLGRAAPLFARGCDGGEGWGCNRIGLLYANGRGVGKDDARAVGYYRRGCDAGEPSACSNLGMMMQTSRGTTRDDAQSVALFRFACDRDDAVACAHLGLMYDQGLGTTTNVSTAIELYKKGCDLGSSGCVLLGYKYLNGTGVAKDAARALQIFQQGCDGGEKTSCDALAEAKRPPAAPPPPPPAAAPPAPAVPAPKSAAPPKPATADSSATLTFSAASQAELLWLVKPDRTAAFEAAWKELIAALAQSGETRIRQATRNMTMFRVNTASPTFVLRLDPAVPGLSYQPGSLLTEAGTADPQRLRVTTQINDSVAGLNLVLLEEVRLRGAAVSNRPAPVDASAAIGRAEGAWNFTTPQAEVYWTIKNGQGAVFETAWQEIVSAMTKSADTRVRQAAQSISLWRILSPGVVNYIVRIDVVAGIKYDLASLIRGVFVQADADALLTRLATAYEEARVLPITPLQ